MKFVRREVGAKTWEVKIAEVWAVLASWMVKRDVIFSYGKKNVDVGKYDEGNYG